ncbi:hypothetical protein ABOM_003900 [Aspergillus bombycis]|uniref:HypA-like protein n=1 Tax=Aspergillus bombycis TaxID=109264 RepID=A0A1F8A618_9EURO|nr:hypothetical protein ABOM_003900 [Aspergillus bombycis]OGM47192.1 hypothetical protein ABOM_003900 [Aspergillus bombycis]
MATPYKIWLTPDSHGVFSTSGLSHASARKVSEVLQHDMENHHIYLNDRGFHDHIVHFMLTIWALGASPDTIQRQLAESMLSVMFAGLLHPIIHLGFAIEFQQPAIVAQALAQAAVHEDYLGQLFLFPAEKAAGGVGQRGMHKTLVQIMDEMQADETLRAAAHPGDDEVFSSGILQRAPRVLVQYCHQWTVPDDRISERLAEMVNAAAYLTATAQHPEKEIKFDFYFVHSLNLSIFFKPILDLPYLSTHSKARLLEMKARMDLLIWASRKMPPPRIADVNGYPIHMGWPEIFSRSYMHPSDDGIWRNSSGQLRTPRSCAMIIDSVGEVSNDMWVRGSGFSESWGRFGPRK